MYVLTQVWASKEQSDSVKNFCENKGKIFGAKIKSKWEGQFLDPPVCFKCNVMPICSSVLNKPVNPEPCY